MKRSCVGFFYYYLFFAFFLYIYSCKIIYKIFGGVFFFAFCLLSQVFLRMLLKVG